MGYFGKALSPSSYLPVHVSGTLSSSPGIASYADALWARGTIFLPLRDEPKERLRRRLLSL